MEHQVQRGQPEILEAQKLILRLVEKRYTGYGRGYVYVSGTASRYPDNDSGKPEIILTDASQLSDLPPT